MAFPTDDGELILDTDASDVGISGVLSQVQDGEEREYCHMEAEHSVSLKETTV